MFSGDKKKKTGPSGKLNIYIRFQGMEGLAVPSYQPGQTILGVVNIEPNTTVNVNRIDLELGWETQGKGDRNTDVVDRDTIDVVELTPDTPLKHPFSFVAPNQPWTYEGELLRIVWHLRVKVDVDAALNLFGLMDIERKEPFVLRP